MANHDSSTESVAAQARPSSTDRISSLPNEILHHILSFLPMKFAIRTSILSNRWRYLWTFNPNIDFPFNYKPPSRDCVNIINQCPRVYNSPNMNRLLFNVSFFRDPTILANNLKNWIQFAITRGVREIVLFISTGRLNSSYVPESLYFHTPLTVLTLYSCKFNLPLEFKGFPFLNILTLTGVNVTDQTVATLLSSCPLLEDLILYDCNELVNLNVSARSLKFLTVYAESLEKLIVNAPQLRCVKIIVQLATQISLNVPCLLEAKVSFDNDLPLEETYEWTPLLKSIVHVTSLTLCSRFIQFLIEEYGPFKTPHIAFMNLKEFQWSGDLVDEYEIHALATFLGHCSLLQNLHIHLIRERSPAAQGGVIDRCGIEDDIQYLQHLDYALNHLKKIKIVGFSRTIKEIGLVRFLLLKSTALDSLHLECTQKDEIKGHIPNWKLEKHLSHLPKISKHAKIVLSKLPPDW